jgi:hypothetical protein
VDSLEELLAMCRGLGDVLGIRIGNLVGIAYCTQVYLIDIP